MDNIAAQTNSNASTAVANEVSRLSGKLQAVALPDELRVQAENMLRRLQGLMSSGANYSLQEYEIISKYIDWITRIPFGKYTQDNLNLDNAKQQMDAKHYGLEEVKEHILEFIATKALREKAAQQNLQQNSAQQSHSDENIAASASKGNVNAIPHAYNQTPAEMAQPILCFVGVQGIGKTTMSRSIAESLGRGFTRISLGAFASVHELRGRNKGESGAEPGQIVKALISAGTMNPVILLDEIDKVSNAENLRADVMAALLEVLDPAQNKQFMDRYLDYPLDLSQVLFITTANNLSGVTAALLDRLEVVRFHSYSDEEKQVIAKNYLLPKVRANTGISAEQLEIAEDVWPLMIRPLGFDPGIRQLERNLTQLARKVAKMLVEGHTGKVVITQDNFREFFPEQIAVMS
ncbi:MAG: AAA family ATPase [Candidatus Dojkabacteria bacterium]